MSQSNKGNKAKRLRNAKKQTSRNKESVRIVAWPLPHKMFTVLKCETFNGLLDAVFATNSKVYRPSSYFDLDPDVGGPSFGGYSFWSQAYGRYRVTSFDYNIKWCNLQADSVIVGAYPIASTSTPSESIANASSEYADENSMGKVHLLGPVSANPTHEMRGKVDCKTLWGTPEVESDALWAADIGTSPTQNSWLMLTATRINGTAMATGAQYVLTVTSYGYWEERIQFTG